MKKLTFLMAILFAGVMVFGQNDAFIRQDVQPGGIVYVDQLGDGNLITGPTTVVDALGNTQSAAYQSAAGYGWTGGDSEFIFCQNGHDNKAYVTQTSTVKNTVLHWKQTGNNNLMKLNQFSKHEVSASLGQQIGNNNKFVGLSNASFCNPLMDVDETKYAVQYDEFGYADIEFLQKGNNNKVGLYQYNLCCKSDFELTQIGDDNKYVGYQYSGLGGERNMIKVSQSGDGWEAKSFQKTLAGGGNNFALMQY